MQFKILTTLLALAMTATALPAGDASALAPRTDSSTCNSNQQIVCCTSLLNVLCVVNALVGGTCQSSSYCCNSGGSTSVGTLINLNALNCVKVL